MSCHPIGKPNRMTLFPLHRPFGGYGPPPEPAKPEIGPEIVDNNLNIENPIESVSNPNNLVRKCEEAAARSRDTAAHPSDCGKFVSCQAGARSGSWIATVRACSPGTVFDEEIGDCNFRENVPRCQEGKDVKSIQISDLFNDKL